MRPRLVHRPPRAGLLVAAALALTAGCAAAQPNASAVSAGSAVSARSAGAAHTASGARATGSATGGVRLTLPAPTGPHPVGTVSLRLVDRAERDPWVPSRPYRELMISVRYPARDANRYPIAPQMLPGEAAGFDDLNSLGPAAPKGTVDWAATPSHARTGAPVLRPAAGRLPVVLYSPGAGDPRSLGTDLSDDLASRGYVVVMIDHTYDASAVQFPGGRVERSVLPAAYAATGDDPAKITALLRKDVAVRVRDTRFVLDAVDAIAAGRDPDADGRRLPAGLAGALDPHRIGMFGHSAGGFTAAETMHDDRRVVSGADLDGVLGYVQDDDQAGNPSAVGLAGLDRPFLLMGEEGDDHHTVPSWGLLWRHSSGWHRDLTLLGGAHASFTDAEAMVPGIARALGLPAATVRQVIGTADPSRAVAAQEAYLTAFFDHTLRGRSEPLLDGPSSSYPQIRFVR